MKHYTTIEQSKKLLELGLSPESADMYYFLDPTPAGNIYHLVVPQIDFGVKTREPEYNEGDIPCWSLAALVELLPPFIQQSRFGRYTSYWLHMTKRTIRYEYYDESYDGYDYLLKATDDNDCLLDAVYSAIVKLKERKLL